MVLSCPVFGFLTDANFDVMNFLCNNLPENASSSSSSFHSSSVRSDVVGDNFLSGSCPSLRPMTSIGRPEASNTPSRAPP